MEQQLAERLRALRQQQGWTLDQLAGHSGISRATLSRMEKAEVSPTTAVLAKLCAVYHLTLTQLMMLVEAGQTQALVRREQQVVWRDESLGFTRQSVSPPDPHLGCEVLACTLRAGARIHYEQPSRPGLEHHLVLQQGQLALCIDDTTYQLQAGDCLRYKTFGASSFHVPGNDDAHYLLVLL